MVNLLFIAPEFPPIQVAGAFRALRFVTHLPKFGIQPIVVCFNPGQHLDRANHPLNPELADEIPHETPIYYLDLSVFEPDQERLAKHRLSEHPGIHTYSLQELFKKIEARFDINAILATFPPFSAHEIAPAAKSFFKCPLIVDMRDAWSLWGSAPFRTWFHYKSILNHERCLLRSADAVTSVTPQLVDMERRVAERPRENFHWIPNSYDEMALSDGVISLEPGKKRYRLAYVGQFYFNAVHETPEGLIPWYRKMPHRWLHYHATRQRWIYRTPYFFFRAWRLFCETYPELAECFEFHHLGGVPDWLPKMAEEFGLSDHCNWHGFTSKRETRSFIKTCDAMLSTSIKVEDGEDYCLASKTFDYIVAKKPILGFVSAGAQRDFLENTNAAVLFEPDNTESCVRKLHEVVEQGIVKEIDQSFLSGYSSVVTTEILARIVKDLVISR